MSVFTRQNEAMLRRAGDVWTATIDNELVEFFAVFDAENRLEDDSSGLPVLIAGSVLTTLYSTAKKLSFGQELTDSDESVWTVREVVRTEDGTLARVNITLKSENSDDC